MKRNYEKIFGFCEWYGKIGWKLFSTTQWVKSEEKNDLENVLKTFSLDKSAESERTFCLKTINRIAKQGNELLLFQFEIGWEVKSEKSFESEAKNTRFMCLALAFFYENWAENFRVAPTKMTEFLKLYGFKKKNWIERKSSTKFRMVWLQFDFKLSSS